MIESIIEKLPNSIPLPTELFSAFSLAGSYLSMLSPIIPLVTLSTIILLVLAVEISMLSFRTIRWIVSYIPFIGGRG